MAGSWIAVPRRHPSLARCACARICSPMPCRCYAVTREALPLRLTAQVCYTLAYLCASALCRCYERSCSALPLPCCAELNLCLDWRRFAAAMSSFAYPCRCVTLRPSGSPRFAPAPLCCTAPLLCQLQTAGAMRRAALPLLCPDLVGLAITVFRCPTLCHRLAKPRHALPTLRSTLPRNACAVRRLGWQCRCVSLPALRAALICPACASHLIALPCLCRALLSLCPASRYCALALPRVARLCLRIAWLSLAVAVRR